MSLTTLTTLTTHNRVLTSALFFLQILYFFDRKAKRNRDDSDRNTILLKCFCIIIALL